MGIVSSTVSGEDGKSLDNHNWKQRGMSTKVEKNPSSAKRDEYIAQQSCFMSIKANMDFHISS